MRSTEGTGWVYHKSGCACTMCRAYRWRDEKQAMWARAESTAPLIDRIDWLDAAGIRSGIVPPSNASDKTDEKA